LRKSGYKWKKIHLGCSRDFLASKIIVVRKLANWFTWKMLFSQIFDKRSKNNFDYIICFGFVSQNWTRCWRAFLKLNSRDMLFKNKITFGYCLSSAIYRRKKLYCIIKTFDKNTNNGILRKMRTITRCSSNRASLLLFKSILGTHLRILQLLG
jgi:hypothetical protein